MIFKPRKKAAGRQPLDERRRQAYEGATRAPKAFSYHANRLEQDANTGRQQNRDEDKKNNKVARYLFNRAGFVLASVAVVFCLINVLKLSSNPKVEPLLASSNAFSLHSPAVYQSAASALFKKSLANNNKITVDTQSIEEALKKEFPELADVSIAMPLLGHRPIVYVQPTQPAFILSSSEHQAFIIDENGRALIDINEVPDLGKLKLLSIQDQSGLPLSNGNLVLPNVDVAFIKTIIAQFKAQKIGISALILPAGGSELDVHLSGKQFFVKFDLHNYSSGIQQAGTFISAYKKLNQEGRLPSSYIDVRVLGRAYYR